MPSGKCWLVSTDFFFFLIFISMGSQNLQLCFIDAVFQRDERIEYFCSPTVSKGWKRNTVLQNICLFHLSRKDNCCHGINNSRHPLFGGRKQTGGMWQTVCHLLLVMCQKRGQLVCLLSSVLQNLNILQALFTMTIRKRERFTGKPRGWVCDNRGERTCGLHFLPSLFVLCLLLIDKFLCKMAGFCICVYNAVYSL